jgi:hypothetical protein
MDLNRPIFKISVNKVTIPEGAGYTHDRTSYQISQDGNFDNEETLLKNIVEDYDRVNSYNYKLPLGINNVYVRVKAHYSDNRETAWERPILLNENQKGFKFSTTIIGTPEITTSINTSDVPLGAFTVDGSEFMLYAGGGSHQSTTWGIYTLEEQPIWTRAEDRDNLTSIKIPGNLLESNKGYVIKATYHSDTNESSNEGRLFISTGEVANSIIRIDEDFTLYNNTILRLNASIFTSEFKSIDLIITNMNDNIIMEALGQATTMPTINTNGLLPNVEYKIKVVLNLTSGYSTPPVAITKVAILNPYSTIDTSYTYTNNSKTTGYVNLNGGMSGYTEELFDNSIILPLKSTGGLCIFDLVDRGLQQRVNLSTISIPDADEDRGIGIKQLNNGRVLLEYYNGTEGYPVFKVLDYNQYLHSLEELVTINRDSELGCACLRNSVVDMSSDGYILYVPNGQSDGNLDIKRIDIVTGIVSKVVELPGAVQENINLSKIDNNTLLVVGDNNYKYLYNISANIFTTIQAAIPDTYTVENKQTIRGINGEIIFLDIDEKDTYGYILQVLIFNPSTQTFRVETISVSIPTKYSYGIKTISGNIYRIGQKYEDPQVLNKYSKVSLI